MVLRIKICAKKPAERKLVKVIGNFHDFEDAIQYNTAIENGITTLLTRNLKDFKKAEIAILTAQQYLQTID